MCVKKIISEIQKNINLSLWIFIYKGRCKASVSSSFRRRYKGGTFVQRRAALPRSGLSSSVQVALEAVLGELPRAERSLGARAPTKKRNRCGLCIRSNKQKDSVTCTSFLSFICPEHTGSKTVTVNCTECAAAGDND